MWGCVPRSHVWDLSKNVVSYGEVGCSIGLDYFEAKVDARDGQDEPCAPEEKAVEGIPFSDFFTETCAEESDTHDHKEESQKHGFLRHFFSSEKGPERLVLWDFIKLECLNRDVGCR